MMHARNLLVGRSNQKLHSRLRKRNVFRRTIVLIYQYVRRDISCSKFYKNLMEIYARNKLNVGRRYQRSAR